MEYLLHCTQSYLFDKLGSDASGRSCDQPNFFWSHVGCRRLYLSTLVFNFNLIYAVALSDFRNILQAVVRSEA